MLISKRDAAKIYTITRDRSSERFHGGFSPFIVGEFVIKYVIGLYMQ